MRHSVFLLSAAVCAMASSPAVAQSADAGPQSSEQAEASQFAEGAIIVTARRRAEDVSKVPIAVTAFSGEQLITKNIQNVGDVSRVTPGLNISTGGSRTNPFIVIRGQSKAVTGNASPGVVTYFNDVPLPTYGSLIQTYDMENIQVLKGPQGTLFGRNSIGGALLTVSKGPSHEFGGYVLGDVGQYDYTQVEGAINIPIIKDKVALRFAAQVGHDGGNVKTFVYDRYTVENPSPGVFLGKVGDFVPNAGNADEYSNQSYRVSLLLEPVDGITNVTVADYSRIKGLNNQLFANPVNSGTIPFLPTSVLTGLFGSTLGNYIGSFTNCPSGNLNCNLAAAVAAAQGQIDDRFMYTPQDPALSRTIVKGISNTTTIEIGDDHQFKNIIALRTTDSFTNTTLTGLTIPTIMTGNQVNLKQFTEEAQFSGSLLNNKLQYTVGGFYYEETPNGPGGYQALEVNAFFGLSHSLAVTYLKNTSKAVYGQFDYSLEDVIDGLTVTGGVRQTWDTQSACTTENTFPIFGEAMLLKRANDTSVIPSEAECRAGSGTNIQSAQIFPDADFKKLTYTVGANWQISPSAMIYFAHRRGYRGGGYNTPLLDPFLSGSQTFAPETLEDFEIGAKGRWEAGQVRGTFEVAAYTGKDKGNQLPFSTSQLSGSAAPCVAQALGTPGHLVSNCTTNAGAPGSRVPINGQTTTVNAADLTIRGIEAAATITPVSWLTLGGNFSYTQVKVDRIFVDANFGAVLSSAIPSRPLPSVVRIQGQPTWVVNGNVTINYPGEVLGGDLSANFDYHYNSSFNSVEVTTPGSHQFDLRAGIDKVGGTNLSVYGYVRNLFDNTVYAGTGSSSPSGIGTLSYVLGRPRTIGLQLMYRFGAQ